MSNLDEMIYRIMLMSRISSGESALALPPHPYRVAANLRPVNPINTYSGNFLLLTNTKKRAKILAHQANSKIGACKAILAGFSRAVNRKNSYS